MTSVGITVNGQDQYLNEGTTVRQLLGEMGLPERGIALAVDGALLAKSDWDRPLERGWTLDIFTAVQGG